MAKSADYNLGIFDFGRGWYVISESAEVTRRPSNIHYFGQDLVLYRGESGRPVLLEAYCPHMGTHLGKSRASATATSKTFLEGDSIRCPFHAWRFGPDGRCNHIPYFTGPIPDAARVRSWPLEERYGLVFAWNDPEALSPDFDVPEVSEWDDPDWFRWAALDHVADLPCHAIEVFDNNSDWAHLNHCHGGRITHYENEVDGHCYRQRQSMVSTHDGGAEFGLDPQAERRLSTINAYHGPGLNLARFLEANAVQLISATPIDNGSVRVRQCAMMKRVPGASDEAMHDMLASFNKNMIRGLGIEDGEIWQHKRPALKVMQLPTDGPFRQARVWYSQFFNPREKAVDILKPVQGMHYVRDVPPYAAIAAQ